MLLEICTVVINCCFLSAEFAGATFYNVNFTLDRTNTIYCLGATLARRAADDVFR